MVNRNDIVTVEICKSHKNIETNPFVGVIRDGKLMGMIVIFDKNSPHSKNLEVSRFAQVQIVHVLKTSMIGRFISYTNNPADSAIDAIMQKAVANQ